MKPKNTSWGGFEKFKPVDDVLKVAQRKLRNGIKLKQREVAALAREASRGNDVVRKEGNK